MHWPVIASLFVSLVAFTLRLYRLDAQSLWWDEAFSIALAEKGLAQITFGDFHPPLYHYILHFWLGQVGKTEFAARFLSVVCGTLIVPLVYQLGRRLFDPPTGVMGALFVTLSPVHLWYSQEARMYILVALEYLTLLYIFHRLTDSRKVSLRAERSNLLSACWGLLWRSAPTHKLGRHTCHAERSEASRYSRIARFFVAKTAPQNDSHGFCPLQWPAAPWPTRNDKGRWAALIGVEVAALYTHYFVALVIAYLTATAVFGAVVRRRWRFAARWLSTQVLVGLAYLPWLPVALPLMGTYKPEGAQPPVLGDFVWQVWHFFNGGTLALVGRHATFTDLSALAAALFVGLALFLAWRDPRRRRDFQLLAHSAVPLALVFLLMQLRPGFHPRYVVMLAAPMLLLLGRGISFLSRGVVWEKLVAAGVAGAFLATFAVGLQATAADPRFQREDVRSLARHLERETSPWDVILFGYEDDAFRYYYQGKAAVSSLDLRAGDSEVRARLADLVSGRGEVWLVTWDQAPVDQRGILPWLLERSGRTVDRWHSPGLWAQAYDLESPPALPVLEKAVADFGPVILTGSFYEPAPAGEAVAVALRWRWAGQKTAVAYKATVLLEDQKGRRIASQDLLLLDEQGRPTADWRPGTEAVNYYLLPLPIGTPPVSYRLRVGVYEAHSLRDLDLRGAASAPAGQRFALGSVRVLRAAPPTPPRSTGGDWGGAPLEAGYVAIGRPVAEGLILEGYALDRPEGHAEQALGVALRWIATRGDLRDYSPVLRLVQEGRVVAEAAGRPVYGEYPTSAWAPGEIVVDWRDLAVAPDALRGVAALELALGESVIALAEIPVEAPERRFSLPSMQYPMDVSLGGFARLVGYDLDCRGTVRLTLYWQAINDGSINMSYTVFTHLLSGDGRLIAQHDGLPAGGTRPTTSWVQGEVIADTHDLAFVVPEYRGEARIEVGLYDLATMTRITTPVGEDRILLPSPIEVTGGQ